MTEKQPRKALHTALNNVQTELDYIEKQIKKINDALHITEIEAQNTYLLLELNNMLDEYSLEKDLTAQKVVSKIRRILYKVSEMKNKQVQHGEKRAI